MEDLALSLNEKMERLVSTMSWSRTLVVCTVILIMGIILVTHYKQTTKKPRLQLMFDKSKLEHQSKEAEEIVNEISSKDNKHQPKKAEEIVKDIPSKGKDGSSLQ